MKLLFLKINKKELLPISVLFSTLFLSGLFINYNFTDPYVTGKTFHLSFWLSTMVFTILAHIFYNRREIIIKLNYIDVFGVLLLLYGLLRAVTTPSHSFLQQESILFFGGLLVYFITLYFVSKYGSGNNESIFIKIIIISILVTTVIQIIAGYLQLTGTIESNNTDYIITGFFNNPGPYAIYLAILFPFLSGLVLYKYCRFAVRIFLGIVSISIIVILPFTQSRTGWISSVISLLFLLFFRYNLIIHIKKLLNNSIKRITVILLIVVLFTTVGYNLFQYKKNSALGRKFIWQTTINAIKNKPLVGYGIGQYEKTLNTYQAKYFKENPSDIKNAMLAGENQYAFNDYLQLTSNFGVLGLLIFLGFIISIFRGIDKHNKSGQLYIPALAAILSLLIASLFSYPLQKTALVVLFFFFIGLASTLQSDRIFSISLSKNKSILSSVLLLILVALFLYNQTEQFYAQKRWKAAIVELHSKQNTSTFQIYKDLYPLLKHDRLFMFNYGAELFEFEKYDKSILIMEETLELYNSDKVYMYLGKSYENTEQLDKAIVSFEYALYLIPHKFYPKYRLVPLYYGIGEEDKAICLANEIMQMKVKIPSKTIDDIKREIQLFLNVYGN